MAKQKKGNKLFRIEGQLINRNTGDGISGLRVETWDKDKKLDDPLGSATTDANGCFLVEFHESDFQDSCGDLLPDVYFKIYSGDTLIKSTEDSVDYDLSRETVIIIEMDMPTPDHQDEPLNLSVSGKIITDKGVAAKGLKVIAIDKNPGNDSLLGKTITDASGNYAVFYTRQTLQQSGKTQADIQIKVTAPTDETKIYGASAVHYNAAPDEKINLALQSDTLDQPPEFQQITADLLLYIKEGSFRDLQENEERQDISYLANKTGWDARLVAMVSLADKYGHETGIEAQFYYSLFRAGMTTDRDVLYRANAETVKKTWEKAVEQNIIAASLQDKIPESLTVFKEYGAAYLLEQANPVGVSSLKDMLDISLPDALRQQEFIGLYYQHTGDMSGFWAKAEETFGAETAANLRLDAKLGYLTMNNAPLITQLRTANHIENDPLDLVRSGFYKTQSWRDALDGGINIPENLPGETEEEKKKNYCGFMTFQLKRSYPTAIVAEMVNGNELPLKGTGTVKKAVYNFFMDTQGRFEIGEQPVEQFIKENKIKLGKNALREVKKLQRMYQVSPSDNAMKTLMENNFDSAYSIVQYGEQEFTDKFADALGGEDMAKLTYNKAHQVHGTVLNMAVSYLTYRTNPAVYAISGHPQEQNEKPQSALPAHVRMAESDSAVIGYPTLEELFKEVDYCACDHCRSVLSPAAYLVELLQFLNLEAEEIKAGANPFEVLRDKRPDIQHIQLTCENTNRVLPYIDLVNEILEYYVVNNSIAGFKAPDVEDITSEELLASPQFVKDEAYTNLKGVAYPFNLPFDYHLEALRLYYGHLKVPLHEAMAKLRVDDELDTPGGPDDPPYAWRDIYTEYLGISPQEYELLTNSGAHNLPACFGEDENMAFNDFNLEYRKAKTFARRTGISYKDLIEIIKTPFINPHAHLIPRLEKLEVGFDDIRDFLEGIVSTEEFEDKIPTGLDPSKYDGDVLTWLEANYDGIMHIIILRDFSGKDEGCGFDKVELRYSLPDENNNYLEEIEFWRLLRFIRLWKTLGWTIEETSKTITALYKDEFIPAAGDSKEQKKTKLDNGFKDLLVKIAHVKRIMEALNLTRKKSLLELLALWGDIDTHGERALYKRMFLHSTILNLDDVFKKDEYGGFLENENQYIYGHKPALQAAFNLTGEELSLIIEHAGFDETTKLYLEHISKIFRYGFLARTLRLSIREFIILETMSGIDPFAGLEGVPLGVLRFIEAVKLIKQSGFKAATLDYLLRHNDASGQASPSRVDILAFAKTIKGGLVRIEQDHQVEDDPTGELTKEKMALVYENDVVDIFFGLLKRTSSNSVDYEHPQAELAQEITDISDKLIYDHNDTRLIFQGVMTEAMRDQFETAVSNPGFITAVQTLCAAGQDEFSDFFAKYPELKVLYDGYADSTQPEDEKLTVILNSLLADLVKKLKHLFIKQTLSASANIDPAVLAELLENKEVLHSGDSTDAPALNDFLQLEENGSPSSQFYLETPNNGFYNFYIEADAGATIAFSIDGSEIGGSITGEIWQTDDSIELTAGKLYLFEFEITGSADITSLKWESTGIEKISIPVKYMYPYERIQNFSSTYLRVLKAAALVEGLALTGEETRFCGTHTDFQVDGEGFLNAIPAPEYPGGNVAALFGKLTELFRYARLKESLKIKDHRLVTLFENPNAMDENGESLLLKVTGWEESSKNELLKRFDWVADDLSDLGDFQWDLYKFLRVYEAFEVVNKFGVPVAGLLEWTTNRPGPEKVWEIQCSFKAKYDESGWLEVLQPINDELRDKRRDALVSYILWHMQGDVTTRHIDTPDKLFEHFLIDVEMGTCMKTSRIKQAISSVQLFVQRCLMNLEPNVAPISIKKEQWEWMKRYRVWEANRKVFLYPENWLEPELRDNKSPFFRDLEGELLQADITAELAETAFLNYLEKLDDVAKLEISGMYLQEHEKGDKDKDILHVFGRTAGATRKYYYRRYQYGYWTPWEKVDLDIEDNPLLPVVWKDRLFLFWLNIVRKGADGKTRDDSNGSKRLTTLTLDQLKQQIKETIEINLSWSEYYKNKWRPKKTSDFEKPVVLGQFKPGEFKRENIKILSAFRRQKDDPQRELIVCILCPGASLQYFKLFNKYSVPIRLREDTDKFDVGQWLFSENLRLFAEAQDQDKLHVGYWIPPKPLEKGHTNKSFNHEVLTGAYRCETVQPHHVARNIFKAPFFFQDAKHVFFVKPEESWKTLIESDPPLHLEPSDPGSKNWFDIEGIKTRLDNTGREPDPNPLDSILLMFGTVNFGGTSISARGSQFTGFSSNIQIANGTFETGLSKSLSHTL
jgi:hypothetical protein